MAKSIINEYTTPAIMPTFANVLVKPEESESTTASGIILPDSAKEKQSTVGTVMAVGPGHTTGPRGEQEEIIVKVGDKVMYKKWGGNEVKVGNEEWTIVDQKDILAIVS